jgi:hypothetical protein
MTMTSELLTAYVVESPAINQVGVCVGTMRVYVCSEERAVSLAAERPDRTWRQVALEDLPPHVLSKMEAPNG